MHRGTKRVLKDSFRSFKIIIVFVAFRIFIIARCSRLIGNHVSGNLYYFTFERASQHFLLLETWNNFSKTLHPFSQKISFWLKIWRYPIKLSKNLGLKKESRHFSLKFFWISAQYRLSQCMVKAFDSKELDKPAMWAQKWPMLGQTWPIIGII